MRSYIIKKIISILVGITLVIMAGSAWSIPTTWTDMRDFDPDILIPPTHYFEHDISDGLNGFKSSFMGGNDWISSYILTVSLYDDNNPSIFSIFSNTIKIPDGSEAARIWTTGGVYREEFNFSSASVGGTGNFWGRLDLWMDGRLGVFVGSDSGDFYLASSQLVAYGDDGTSPSNPVPEPGTMVLLGFGMLGLVIYGKRRMNRDT